MESTLILLHGGYFQRYGNGNMEYVNGQFCVWEEYDINYLSKHQLEEMAKLCGNYAGTEKIWWLVPDCGGYLQVVEDADILDLGNIARRCGNEVHIYFEHPIIEPDIVALEEAVHESEVVTVDDEVEIVADFVNESVADVVNENVVEAEINVNEGVVDVNEGETVNEDQAHDDAQEYETDEDSDYSPSYFSGDDDTFMEVGLELEPSRRRNKRPTEGQGTGINVEENVDENDFTRSDERSPT